LLAYATDESIWRYTLGNHRLERLDGFPGATSLIRVTPDGEGLLLAVRDELWYSRPDEGKAWRLQEAKVIGGVSYGVGQSSRFFAPDGQWLLNVTYFNEAVLTHLPSLYQELYYLPGKMT